VVLPHDLLLGNWFLVRLDAQALKIASPWRLQQTL
jgi:hypothetical protein